MRAPVVGSRWVGSEAREREEARGEGVTGAVSGETATDLDLQNRGRLLGAKRVSIPFSYIDAYIHACIHTYMRVYAQTHIWLSH